MKIVAAVFVGILATACSAPKTPTSRQLAAEEEAATVALVHSINELGIPDEHEKPSMFCSGVFVSPTVILTAGHCAAPLGMTTEQIVAHLLGLDDSMPPASPIGAVAQFAAEEDYKHHAYRTGKVIGWRMDVDLGAIRVDAPFASPNYVRLSTADIVAADRVELVGHIGGYTWSYAEGLVSSVRPQEPNGHGKPMPTIQVAAPVGHGNSGGGLFNSSGELIGIFSYIDSRAPGMGFCVHRDAIQKFLATLPAH